MANKNFNTSVNIKFDWQNSKLINNYIPTPSHAEFLRNVTSSLLGINNQSAHLLIGPYGSGKSLISLIVSSIMSNNITNEQFIKLAEKFSDVDDEIYSNLMELEQYEKNYLPIILSGAESSFSGAIIQNIINTADRLGFRLELKTDYHRILSIIEEWENNYKNTFKQFKLKLKERNLTWRSWKKELSIETKREVQWFASVYPLLTSGANLKLNYNLNLTETLTEILSIFEEHNLKLLIVFDEFGRFIQSLDNREFIKTMGDLQELSEFITRKSERIQLLLVTHKNLTHYINSNNEDLKNDFERIEKRLRKYYIESDKSTFYRIAAQYVKSLKLNDNNKDLEALNLLKKYNLFDDLNSIEVEKIIFKGIYPIHPVTLLLLPRLSNLFGQNERTLFTFLESNELGGLQNHITRTDTYYLPPSLFDYFFNNSTLLYSDDSFRDLKIYYKNISKISNSDNPLCLDILKLLTMWNLINLNKKVNLNVELISYSLNVDTEKVEECIKELVYKKVIYKNRRTNQWLLAESSVAEIDELLQVERGRTVINDKTRIQLLNKLLPKKFYFANEYNNEYDMTRFAKIEFVFPESIDKLEFEGTADFYVYIVLVNSKEIVRVMNSVKQIKHSNCLFTLIEKNEYPILNWLDDYQLINSLMMQKSILFEYQNLENELELIKEEIIYQLDNFYKPIVNHYKNLTWFNKYIEISFNSVNAIENYISEFMFKNYPHTPVIHNDAINRYRVNSLQQKALISVVDGVIHCPNHITLGIEGNGPDYLIYATVFKNNSLNIGYLDNIIYDRYRILREKLLEIFRLNEESTLKVIVDVFKGEGFGIRAPLFPLLFVSLIRDVWDQILFSSKGVHITSIDGKKLYSMFENPLDYEFKFIMLDTGFKNFLREIEQSFKEYESSNVSNESILIKSSSCLLSALRSLPKFTQITELVDEEQILFKSIVRRLEVRPLEAFEKIYKYYQTSGKVVNLYNRLKKFQEEFSMELVGILLETLKLSSVEEIPNYLKQFDEKVIINSKILKVLSLNDKFNINDFCINYLGISIDDWTDATFDLYKSQLKIDNSKIGKIDTNFDRYSDLLKEVELSTKATSIYNNVKQMLINAGRNLPREEIELILQKLLHEHIS